MSDAHQHAKAESETHDHLRDYRKSLKAAAGLVGHQIHRFRLKREAGLLLIPMLERVIDQARHCFAFEQDFVGNWRCIPLCVRRKLDLSGVKLKLNHWLGLSQQQRQELVDWADDPKALDLFRDHLRLCTAAMADGMVTDLPVAVAEPWQCPDQLPDLLLEAAQRRRIPLALDRWAGLSELERFALCKLARPGHDHHNLEAAFSEVLG